MDRYEVALHHRKYWDLLLWKGDLHTKGIYFNQDKAYLIDKTYAVRITHDESAPPAFYLPGENETDDEVITEYPYEKMEKSVNKYYPLFQTSLLTLKELEKLFPRDTMPLFTARREELIDFLQLITNKRARDRSHFIFDSVQGIALLMQKKNKIGELLINTIYNFSDFELNANNLLHAINLFSFGSTILFSKCHDRIIVTDSSTSNVEAVISLRKKKQH